MITVAAVLAVAGWACMTAAWVMERRAREEELRRYIHEMEKVYGDAADIVCRELDRLRQERLYFFRRYLDSGDDGC